MSFAVPTSVADASLRAEAGYVVAPLSTQYGQCTVACWQPSEGISSPNLALIFGDVRDKASVLTRVQSECVTGHVFGSLACDCGGQLHDAVEQVAAAECGVVVYLRQEGRGIGLMDKIKAYALQTSGLDTVDANVALGHEPDERTYEAAGQMLRDLGVRSIRLLTNNPQKADGLRAVGIHVDVVVALPPRVGPGNRRYLAGKRDRLGHVLDLDADSAGGQPH
jgi:GTP cyclohydrolase II